MFKLAFVFIFAQCIRTVELYAHWPCGKRLQYSINEIKYAFVWIWLQMHAITQQYNKSMNARFC